MENYKKEMGSAGITLNSDFGCNWYYLSPMSRGCDQSALLCPILQSQEEINKLWWHLISVLRLISRSSAYSLGTSGSSSSDSDRVVSVWCPPFKSTKRPTKTAEVNCSLVLLDSFANANYNANCKCKLLLNLSLLYQFPRGIFYRLKPSPLDTFD